MPCALFTIICTRMRIIIILSACGYRSYNAMASIVISDDSASENDTERFQPFPCRHTAATATGSRSRVQKTCERAPTKERHERAKKRKATTVPEDEVENLKSK